MNIIFVFIQFFVRAYDLGTPRCTSQNQATVVVNVIRNQNCPDFRNLPADVTISQRQDASQLIYSVIAIDNDPPVNRIFMKLAQHACYISFRF